MLTAEDKDRLEANLSKIREVINRRMLLADPEEKPIRHKYKVGDDFMFRNRLYTVTRVRNNREWPYSVVFYDKKDKRHENPYELLMTELDLDGMMHIGGWE